MRVYGLRLVVSMRRKSAHVRASIAELVRLVLSTVGDLPLELLAAATGAHSRCVHGVLVDMYFLSRDWCLVVNGVS